MDDLTQFGGRPVGSLQAFTAGAPPAWNFGVTPMPAEVDQLIRATPTLHQKFPAMVGKWDGTSTINHYEAAKTVLGTDAEKLIQWQPRGTCGGRAGSAAIDFVQCILIASGKRARFKHASHAFLYWQARKKYRMDRGSPSDEGNDGVAGGSIPEILTSVGVDTRDETGDLNWYGPGSDDLACQWGAGKIEPSLARQLEQYATDNVVTEWAPVRSAQELADGIAAGGIGIGSDMQGFTMTRDAAGFCRPQGQWAHYQIRVSVGVWGGRKGFGYWQSWGKDTPQGTLLPGHPGNCFGVEFAAQDRIVKSGEWAVVFGVPLWELEAGGQDIPWIF